MQSICKIVFQYLLRPTAIQSCKDLTQPIMYAFNVPLNFKFMMENQNVLIVKVLHMPNVLNIQLFAIGISN